MDFNLRGLPSKPSKGSDPLQKLQKLQSLVLEHWCPLGISSLEYIGCWFSFETTTQRVPMYAMGVCFGCDPLDEACFGRHHSGTDSCPPTTLEVGPNSNVMAIGRYNLLSSVWNSYSGRLLV